MKRITGQIVDVRNRKIFPGEITIHSGKIQKVRKIPASSANESYILPGFIDSHIHIESSMLVPAEFARWAIPFGTVATVSDPHEIANVLGIEGVEYMIDNGNKVPLKFYFGAPSCVPATPFETAGAALPPDEIQKLLARSEIKYLAEMMNWPGVLQEDEEVMEKIKIAQQFGKVIDGHAPGLRGEQAKAYHAAGISTDHECTTLEEAQEKISYGAKIAIREGSAAKNFEALHPLFLSSPEALMFCSDDKHPDELMKGHINELVQGALAQGYGLFDVLHAACIHPIDHYDLEVGSLQAGDPADFICVSNLRDFKVEATYINGEKVYDGNGVTFDRPASQKPVKMDAAPINPKDLRVTATGTSCRVILPKDGQLITEELWAPTLTDDNNDAVSQVKADILKIVVYNRYSPSPPAVAFIRGFGLKAGALASSVAHDCHNIIAVGVSDGEIAHAINKVITMKGGISVATDDKSQGLPLPVAGLMTTAPGDQVAEQYEQLDQQVKALGCRLRAPYMTLSFMALLVIPSLKLSDKGLFDGRAFEFVDLFSNTD